MAMSKRECFWLVLAIVVFVIVCGVVGLIETKKTPPGAKTVPQERVAKVTITCELGKDRFDIDCDAVADTIDNCPTVPNLFVSGLGQPDQDSDGVGDACDFCNEPGLRDDMGCPRGQSECESDSDCPLGLECFREKCSYPCRGALMCPVGMGCAPTAYCVGVPL